MDAVTEMLYGGDYPRSVGTPIQFWVFNDTQLERYIDFIDGKNNAYCSISWFPEAGNKEHISETVEGDYHGQVKEAVPVTDKISLDFDSHEEKEEKFEDIHDHEAIEMMRNDPDLADYVLGDVVDEAASVMKRARSEGTPSIAVFSGFGLHVHLMHKPSVNPKEENRTTIKRYMDNLNLESVDASFLGDNGRILRIPNVRRVTATERYEPIAVCDMYTIPLNTDEMQGMTAHKLLELAKEPRVPELTYKLDMKHRPEMTVYEDYLQWQNREESESKVGSIDPNVIDDEGFRWFAEEIVQMPCMIHFMQADNPDHPIRANLATMLFNAGFSIDEAVEFIRKLGWRDFSPETTRKQLKHIYKKGYSDRSCETMMRDGYCVHRDDPEDCETYGWSGGRPEWKQ